jgi:hypothetical protein
MHMAMIQDCLMGADRERLKNACSRPCWTVARNELYAGHCFTCSGESCPTPTCKLQTSHSSSQMELAGLVQYITHRHQGSVLRPAVILHPWQAEPPLPGSVTIDVSHHYPQSLPAPIGWEIIQRNKRTWMVEQNSQVTKIDAAQYNMLLAISCDQETASAPTTQFLVDISTSCRAQKVADLEYYVHWSRHLLANIQWKTGCELLIGASTVTYNSHFLYFASPHLVDEHLGAVTEWPMVPALLIIDSFSPHLRSWSAAS